MIGRFDESPYPRRQAQDFGPAKPNRVEARNGGRTIVIGDHTDLGFQVTLTYIQPGPDAIDVVIHGLPGRFIDRLGGKLEIPAAVVAELIESAGVVRGTPSSGRDRATGPLTRPEGSRRMKVLEPLLLVRELPPVCSRQRQHLPSLRELISPVPRPDEAKVLAYLRQGVDCGIYNDPGMLYDVLQPGRRIELPGVHPHLMMTDGTWVWPGAVVYYVTTYHVRLPERFLLQAEATEWKIDAGRFDVADLNWDAFDAVEVVETPTG